MTYPKVNETEVDGVQTFWVDAGNPFSATLMFRVGLADEELPERGITHLVEHLALTPLRHVTHQFNGGVGMDSTNFWAAGAEADVVAFMQRLCENLADPPVDHLEVEAGVLVAESMGYRATSHQIILTQRFGPFGPGVMTYPEYGLRRFQAADVGRWAADWFTADNAVLVLSGPPPADLRLPLPRGERRHLVLPPDSIRYRGDEPTRVLPQELGVAVGAYGTRSIALRMAAQAVALRAQEHMRHELGRVYGVAHDYLALTPDEVYLYWGADSEAEHAVEVAEAFVGVLEAVASEGPSADELDRLVSMATQLDVMDESGLARSEAHRIAADALRGHHFYDIHRMVPEMRAVTRQEAAEALQEALPGATSIAAEGSKTSFAEPLSYFDEPTKGKTIRVKENGVKRRWILGNDAMSSFDEVYWVTIRFDEVLVLDRWPDGGCAIVDNRGAWIGIAPAHRKSRELVAEMVGRVAPERVIPATR